MRLVSSEDLSNTSIEIRKFSFNKKEELNKKDKTFNFIIFLNNLIECKIVLFSTSLFEKKGHLLPQKQSLRKIILISSKYNTHV